MLLALRALGKMIFAIFEPTATEEAERDSARPTPHHIVSFSFQIPLTTAWAPNDISDIRSASCHNIVNLISLVVRLVQLHLVIPVVYLLLIEELTTASEVVIPTAIKRYQV